MASSWASVVSRLVMLNTTGVKSMLEMALRVNGRMVLNAARFWNCSAPNTASAVITCGHVRCIPRGVALPWKLTISRSSAVRARTASYHCKVGCV